MEFKRIRKDGRLALIEVMIKHYPNNSWAIEYENNDKDSGEERLVWNDTNTPEPSKETINNLYDEMQLEWANIQYQRKRQPEYPSLADFADAYYWMSKGDSDKMNEYVAKCDAVKAKYPKP